MRGGLERVIVAAVIFTVSGALGACQVEGTAPGAVNGGSGDFRSSNLADVVGSDGRCAADRRGDPTVQEPRVAAVRLGIAECDLVRLQGQPQDVVISDLPDGRRRVEMFYPGNGGTTRGYTFLANRLISTPPGILKQ